MSTARRAFAVGVVLIALGALAVTGWRSSDTATESARAAAADIAGMMPVAAPASSLTSTFYCAGGAADGGVLDSTIVVANPNDRTVSVVLTAYPAAVDGDAAGAQAVAAIPPASKSFTVASHTRAEVRVGDVVAAPFAAALVEADAGSVAVERRVSGSRGTATSPCASSPSSSWYAPSGVSAMDARELLAVFNPFADDAVADVAFVTSDGFRAPPATQGYVVPAGHLALIDVGVVAGRHDQVAAQVVLRRGQVVVDRLQTFDGSGAGRPAAVAATVTAPTTAGAWMFPQGYVGGGVSETFALFNPGAEPSTVDLEITLADPATNGTADPIPVTVPAEGYALVAMDQQPRIPQGVAFSVVARVRSGPDVVPERVIVGSGGSREGYAPALGSPLVARTWLFADGRADATTADWVTLVNPSTDSIARADIAELAQGSAVPIDGLQHIEVPPGGRIDLELGARINRAALSFVVTSDLPIVAERGLYAASGPGLSTALGIPLPEGIALVPAASAPTSSTTTTARPSSTTLPSSGSSGG